MSRNKSFPQNLQCLLSLLFLQIFFTVFVEFLSLFEWSFQSLLLRFLLFLLDAAEVLVTFTRSLVLKLSTHLSRLQPCILNMLLLTCSPAHLLSCSPVGVTTAVSRTAQFQLPVVKNWSLYFSSFVSLLHINRKLSAVNGNFQLLLLHSSDVLKSWDFVSCSPAWFCKNSSHRTIRMFCLSGLTV